MTGSSSPALLCGAECCTGNVRCSRLHPHTYGISLVDKLQRKYEAIEERPVRVCGLCRQDLALDVINAWIIGTENTSAREMLVLAVMAGWSRPQKINVLGGLRGMEKSPPPLFNQELSLCKTNTSLFGAASCLQ